MVYTIEQAASSLYISVKVVRRAVAAGDIDAVKVSGRFIISEDSLIHNNIKMIILTSPNFYVYNHKT